MTIFAPVPYGSFKPQNIISGPTNYPIGLTAQNFMYLYRNIFNLDVNVSFIITAQSSAPPPTDLLGAIDASSPDNSFNASIVGKTTRGTTILTKVKSNFALPLTKLSAIPLESPPKHEIAGFGGSFLMDFSDIIFSAGLYYPKIIISLSYGGSNGVGTIVGGVKFLNFGEIPIYYPGGSSPFGPLDYAFAGGTITLNQKIDDLTLNKINFKKNEVAIINSNYDLSKYNLAYIGANQIVTTYTNNQISFATPNSSYRGLIKLVKLNPYDSFYHLEEITIN